jgi:hypothetical protein
MDTAPVATQGIPADGRYARPKKPFYASSGVGGHDLFVMGVNPRPGDHSSSVRFRRSCSSGRLCSILFVATELRHATLKPRRSICAGGSSPAPSERLRLAGCAVAPGLMLDLCIMLSSDQNDDDGQPDPSRKADDCAKRTIGLVVAAKARDIP